jgi:predicted phosphodiesterase
VAPDTVRIAVAGDVGHPSAALNRTIAAMAKEAEHRPFDALVLLGDNVYPDGDPAMVDAAVLEPFAPVLETGAELVAVLGNHDVESGRGDEVARRLGMPDRWYQRRIGPAHVLALDSTRAGDPRQLAWLRSALGGPVSPFRIVAMHHPPYSAGWHGSSHRLRWTYGPAFRRGGVDLVLAGHEHDYQRSRPVRGTTYVVSGATTHLRRTGSARFTAASCARHHFVDLLVSPTALRLHAIGSQGQLLDRVVLSARGRRTARRLVRSGRRAGPGRAVLDRVGTRN